MSVQLSDNKSVLCIRIPASQAASGVMPAEQKPSHIYGHCIIFNIVIYLFYW